MRPAVAFPKKRSLEFLDKEAVPTVIYVSLKYSTSIIVFKCSFINMLIPCVTLRYVLLVDVSFAPPVIL